MRNRVLPWGRDGVADPSSKACQYLTSDERPAGIAVNTASTEKETRCWREGSLTPFEVAETTKPRTTRTSVSVLLAPPHLRTTRTCRRPWTSRIPASSSWGIKICRCHPAPPSEERRRRTVEPRTVLPSGPERVYRTNPPFYCRGDRDGPLLNPPPYEAGGRQGRERHLYRAGSNSGSLPLCRPTGKRRGRDLLRCVRNLRHADYSGRDDSLPCHWLEVMSPLQGK